MPDVVNVGALPNDGKGDELRPAFVAINAAFADALAKIAAATSKAQSNISQSDLNGAIASLQTTFNAKLSTNGDGSALNVTLPDGTTFKISEFANRLAPKGRKIITTGLASGGGDLSADLTLSVPKASSADITAGSDDAKAVTPLALAAPLAGKASKQNPALTGVGVLKEGMVASPSSSHAGWTFQNTETTAAAILGPQQPPGWFTHDGIRSVVVSKTDATAQTTSAFGFYARSDTPESTTGVTGMFGTSVAAVDHSAAWGFNPTVIDSVRNGVVSNGIGKKLIGIEINPSVTSSDTILQGFSILGSTIAQPKFSAAFTVGHLSAINPGAFRWNNAFVVADGTSLTGYLTGAQQVSGANIPGIQNLLNYRDTMGAARAVTYAASATGSFVIGGTSAANSIQIQPAAAGQFPAVQAFGSDPNVALVLQAQGSGQVVAQSFLSAPQGLYAATFAQFAVPAQMPAYTVGTLPTAGTVGRVAYCTNARVLTAGGTQQAAGAGSGGLVADDGTVWRIAGTNIQVQA